MRAVSSANPNRNNSWFTKESMERSLQSFVNKPILGYFTKGDFVSHNGEWKVDSETNIPYFDTLDTPEGERILGIIRESDRLEIVQDVSGLYWIEFTCALWSQYNFKQVKRLIKDARRAQRMGGPTKNVSVEVDLTDYEVLDNGVTKINQFELIGVTILGSRNGVKVEPGIEGASLSVVDIMGRDLYDHQLKALRLAYEKLDGTVEKKEENKVENMGEALEMQQTQTLSEEVAPENGDVTCATEGEVCPDCGENPCVCAADGGAEETCAIAADAETCACPEGAPEGEGSEGGEKVAEAAEEGEAGTESCEADEQACEEKCEQHEEGAKPEECAEHEAKMALYPDHYDLIVKYEALLAEKQACDEALAKAMSAIAEYEHKDFVSAAKAFVASAKLESEQSAKLIAQCENKEIISLEDLKVKVAMSLLEKQLNEESTPVEENDTSLAAASFSAPVVLPDTNSVFVNSDKQKKKDKDSWSMLHSYIGSESK